MKEGYNSLKGKNKKEGAYTGNDDSLIKKNQI